MSDTASLGAVEPLMRALSRLSTILTGAGALLIAGNIVYASATLRADEGIIAQLRGKQGDVFAQNVQLSNGLAATRAQAQSVKDALGAQIAQLKNDDAAARADAQNEAAQAAQAQEAANQARAETAQVRSDLGAQIAAARAQVQNEAAQAAQYQAAANQARSQLAQVVTQLGPQIAQLKGELVAAQAQARSEATIAQQARNQAAQATSQLEALNTQARNAQQLAGSLEARISQLNSMLVRDQNQLRACQPAKVG